MSPPGWLQAVPPMPDIETARCRGCPRTIYRTPGGHWEDSDGFRVCVKAQPENAIAGNYVFHQPLPAPKALP